MEDGLHSADPRDRSEAFRSVLKSQRHKARRKLDRYAGRVAPRHCPMCSYYGMFGPFGVPRGYDTWCPSRNAPDRHRRIWLAITRRNLLIKSHRLLHFAAEVPQRCTVRPLVGRSATAELRADTQPDHLITIEDIALPDDSFDRTICNHGPEQVDDQRALAEVYRVPLPGGVAILTSPVIDGWAQTDLNPDFNRKEDRLVHFGRAGHRRLFGRDLRDRIRAAGFALDEVPAVEPDVARYGLMRGEPVFIATKPMAGAQ